MELKVADNRKMVELLRANLVADSSTPKIIEIALRHVREEHLASDEFLEATRHLPDGVVVRFTDGIYSLVTNDTGHLLSFH